MFLTHFNDKSVQLLRKIISRGWSEDTAQTFDPAMPSRGQCAVTALVTQDWFGGDLLRAEYVDGAAKGSHYWNRLPDGQEIDITRDQFLSPVFGPAEVRTREYLLSYETTKRRYNSLRRAIAASSEEFEAWSAPLV